MPVVKLTDLSVQTLKPGLYYDAKVPAFAIRVGARRKTWLVVKTRQRLKVTLGHYPALSLAEARKRAQVAIGSPMEVKSSISFEDAKTAFLALPRWRPNSLKVLKSALRYFAWKRPLAKVTHEDIASVLDTIQGNSARAHTLAGVRTFLNWCVPRYIPSSPAAGLRMPKQPSRDRVLSDSELKSVWNAARQMAYPFGIIVQLLVLTGQRKSEIGSLRWEWIGDTAIALPASITKNAHEHTLPLSVSAISLIEACGRAKAGPVFTTRSRTSGETIPYDGFTFHLKALQKASGTSGWTLHDLRRTFATNLAALSVPIHVTEKLLNHVSGTLSGVAAIYNRHTYADEMRAAIEQWEERLLSIVGLSPSVTKPSS